MRARVKAWRLIGVTLWGAALMVAVAIPSGASAHRASVAAVPACKALNSQGSQNMEVWLGDGLGGGVLGGYYYPLEITNVSGHTCTLNGYPGVSAIRGNDRQIGPAATRSEQPHRAVVLAPGATAHAQLRISDWGALCSTQVTADGLKVFPPGQRTSQTIQFSFGACAHRGVLIVGPLRPGVAIPGYTTS